MSEASEAAQEQKRWQTAAQGDEATDTRACTHNHTRSHTCTHNHTRSRTCILTHVHTHSHARAHTYTEPQVTGVLWAMEAAWPGVRRPEKADDVRPLPDARLVSRQVRTELVSAVARGGRGPRRCGTDVPALTSGARTRGSAPESHGMNYYLCHQLPGSEGAGQSDNL